MTHPVELWLFDLSNGMAKQLSPALVGREIEGIWHTSVIVYGKEHFFGGEGICFEKPGSTMVGTNTYQRFPMGDTAIPPEVFYDYLKQLGQTQFSGDKYKLFEHNCNNFSNEVCTFLVGKPIPSFITNLPNEVLQTPFGQMIKPMLESMQPQVGGQQPPASGQPSTSGKPPASGKPWMMVAFAVFADKLR